MNVTSNLPLPVKLLLPILAVITLWLFFSEDPEKTADGTNLISRSSDYAMSNFTMTVMNEQGQPSYILYGQEMAHYAEDDSTEISKPIADIIEQGKDTWVVSSNDGYTQGKGEDLLLTGNVLVTKKADNAIEIRTEKLNLDTVHNTAYTDLAVNIKSPQGVTDSVGLHADLEEQTINLHSRVKGHYNAPPKH